MVAKNSETSYVISSGMRPHATHAMAPVIAGDSNERLQASRRDKPRLLRMRAHRPKRQCAKTSSQVPTVVMSSSCTATSPALLPTACSFRCKRPTHTPWRRGPSGSSPRRRSRRPATSVSPLCTRVRSPQYSTPARPRPSRAR